MRRLCLLLVFLVLPLLAYGADIPQPVGWVNDFAGVISPEYKDKLNALISELEQKTTAEIAVVTIDSIAPYGENEYARMLFDNWKPGKKGKDNGVLVLLAVKERRWRIETGYGLEGVLPDGLCGEIGRSYMVPYFKQGQYSEGLYSGVFRIFEILSGKAISEKQANARAPKLSGIGIFIVVALAFLALFSSWQIFFLLFGIALFSAVILGGYLIASVIFIFAIFAIRKLLGGFIYTTGGYGRGGYGGGFGGGGFGGGGGGGGGAGGGF